MAYFHVPEVRDNYFQDKALTHIVGQPNFSSLQVLPNELKANASSVPSVLGVGMYGQWASFLHSMQCNRTPNCPSGQSRTFQSTRKRH